MVSGYPPAIFLMGPTASGKSALAIKIAQALDTEIISVDSALVYRGMDIGTAKPNQQEREGIKHHLMDILDPSEAFSTGHFRKLALAHMQAMSEQGKIPVLTGGTMLYFNALFHGMAELPEADASVRAELDQLLQSHGADYMHDWLNRVDPEAAARIHPNDPQRVQRALEVYQITGTAISELQKQAKQQISPYTQIKLVIAPKERSVLHQTIAQRFQTMLDAGLVEEVRRLFERDDLDASKPAIRSVGYRQVWEYLDGRMDYSDMVDKGIIATRQLAKRQFTWLRKEREAFWLETGQSDLLGSVLEHIDQTLKVDCRV